MSRTARERLCFALDVGDADTARRWVDALVSDVGVFKVGLELFAAIGPEAVRLVRLAGAECFLDLKLHDIPATVAGAVASAARHGARFLTIHAAAGRSALEAAVRAARDSSLVLLGVTVLTSLGNEDLREIGLEGASEHAAMRFAKLAVGAGLGGLVCSVHECRALRAAFGTRPLLVVPGIRPAGSSTDDQRRVATPAEAIAAGADIVVVGRPIRDAPDPRAAARRILEELAVEQP
ncbi:MAG: orotidine-5'-phosphate decarboxylase [Myxococcota bacterium]|nr:orotidine-5'-phosphate decarboxylase [Myxococcota bacterium]